MKTFLKKHESDLESYMWDSITATGDKRYRLEQVLAAHVEARNKSIADFFMTLPPCTSFLFQTEHIRDLIEDWNEGPVSDELSDEICQNWFKILSKTFVKLYVQYEKRR